MKKFVKFSLVGALNTAVDLGVLNLLVFFTKGENDKYLYLVCKTISFVCAVVNSYFLNKFWVFEIKEKLQNEKIMFITVSTFGLLVNVIVSYVVFIFGGHLLQVQLSQVIIVNMAAIAGTISVLLSNFFGYKYLVFKVKS